MPAPPLLRSLTVWTAATTAAATAVAGLLQVASSPGPGFAGLLVRCCSIVALVAAAWLWLAATVTIVGATRGRVTRVRGVPAPVRRMVLTACGVALTGGLVAGPAHATPGHPRDGGPPGPTTSVSGLPLPDRAASPEAGAVPEEDRAAEIVTVSPGDSLWSIAARRHPDASDAEIEAQWRGIYALNRAEIGADPDLITPAQRLRMPISEVLP